MSGSSIPASAIVAVTPSVIAAGGTALDLSGLILTTSTRVPIGTVPSFPTRVAVANYFGSSALETALAAVYFKGFDNSNKKPGALLFSQYAAAAVGAYLRGADLSDLTLAQLQAISGVLVVSINGTPVTSSAIDLSAATSFSNAGQIITSALGATGPTQVTATGYIGAAFTGSITTTVLTVSAVSSGTLAIGDVVVGAGVTVGTTITALGSGSGLTGTYTVSASQTVASESMTATSNRMVLTGVSAGAIAIGQQITGSGMTAGTFVTAFGPAYGSVAAGTGGTGAYTISIAQQVAAGAKVAVLPTVTYDSISGGFLVVSSTTGAASTVGFGSGTISAALGLTEVTGAALSQGADATTPGATMDAIIATTQNWASFTTAQDPDVSGNANKLAFAVWTNAQDERYVYVAWDTDVTPTASNNATTSLGNIIKAANYSGTIPMYEPSDLYHHAFVLGWIASIDFEETEGRTTMAFRAQAGLTAAVTDQTKADNLIANGYDFYGAYATAADRFVFAYPGSISGDFLWADSYVNQIQLNNALQLALMVLLTTEKSIPYNAAGYAMIAAACLDPINAAVNFGSIRGGVTLSEAQKAEVNAAAGRRIDSVLSTRGWYLLIQDASPQVRAARGSPPCSLFYCDGQSVQQINLASIEVQ